MGEATSPQASTLGWRSSSADTPGLGWTCFCSRPSGSHRGCASWDRDPRPDEAPSLRLRLVHRRGQALLLGAAGLFSARGGLRARSSPALTGPRSVSFSPSVGRSLPARRRGPFGLRLLHCREPGGQDEERKTRGCQRHSPFSVRSDSFKLKLTKVHFIAIQQDRRCMLRERLSPGRRDARAVAAARGR